MKKRLLIILCCVLMICGGVTSVGCNHSMNDYLKYEMLIDGTYSVGLKEEYLESFTVEITYSGLPVIRKQTVKKGWLYDKVPKNIEIPASYNGKPVTKIADFGFANGNIESVTFLEDDYSSRITQIGVAAFYGAALKEITIPENVEVIEEYAFCDDNLSALKIPDKTKRVGEYAFALNPNLSNVNLGTGIDCIDVGTFCGCDSLTLIVIPENIRTFKRYAFDYNGTPVNRCTSPLKNLCYEGDDNEWKKVESDELFLSDEKILYYTEDGDISKYIKNYESIKRVWTWTWKYNSEKDADIFERFEKEVEIIDLVYDNDNSLEGKTYRFSHSDIEISDDGWKQLLQYDKDDKLNKLLTEDEIEIFKKSNNKEEYKALYDEYALEKYGNVYVVFENGRECMWRDGKPDANSYSYKFVNGKVYSMYSWDDYRYSYTITDGTLMEDYEMKTSGNIKYCRKKFCYREI